MSDRVRSFTLDGLVHYQLEVEPEAYETMSLMARCCRPGHGTREPRLLFDADHHREMHFQIVICGGNVDEKTNLIRRIAIQADFDFHIVADNVRMLRGQIEDVFRRYQDNERHVILFVDGFEKEEMEALEGWDWNNSKVKLLLGINEQLSEEAQRYLEVLFGGIYTANVLRD